ncbi:MAG: hypothetical protein R3Y35_09670 [Clostridia bacterium]
MKRKITVLGLACLMLFLTACSSQSDSGTTADLENYTIDYDLTSVSDTVMLSQIINLIYAPEEYENTFFKVTGMFQEYELTDSDDMIYFIVIYDEAGCCPYGVELRFTEEIDLPENYEEITIEALALLDSGYSYLQVLTLE